MSVTVVRVRENTEESSPSGKDDLLRAYEKALASLLTFTMKANAHIVHIQLEPTPAVSLFRLVERDHEDEEVELPAALPADFCWELAALAKSDFPGIGEHFEAEPGEIGSVYSPVLLVESGNVKTFWNRTWTDSLLQFQRVT